MHVVITGASSGIGAALARRAAELPGARLTLIARRKSELEELARVLRCQVTVLKRDLAAPEQMDDWIEEAERLQGPVDVVINNAGSQVVADTVSVDVLTGEASLNLNLVAPLRIIRRMLPGMTSRRSGQIVNIASMAALAPTPRMTYYNAGKAGLAAASEALRGELRGSGVNVVTVYPGIIASTAMARAALAKYESSRLLRLQPTGQEDELARRIFRALEDRRARVIYPRANALARWFPAQVRWMMDRFTPRLRGEATLPLQAPRPAGAG